MDAGMKFEIEQMLLELVEEIDELTRVFENEEQFLAVYGEELSPTERWERWDRQDVREEEIELLLLDAEALSLRV